MTFLRYVIIRAFRNMKGSLFPNLTTIGIIGISMLIFSAFSLIAFNLGAFLKVWEDKIAVIAYLKKGTPLIDVGKILKNTRQIEGVETVKYLSPFDAMTFMETKLGGQKNLLEGIPPGVLPSSLEIQLKKEYRNSSRIKEVVSQLTRFPEIEEVQYGQEWVETFSAIVHMVGVTQWVLGGILLAGMTFIISNTLQLTISSRREEIEMMHIVGASPAFIQVPFYVEGIVQGLVGAGLAVLFLFFFYYKVLLYKFFFQYLTPSMKEWVAGIPVLFLPGRTIGMIISGGMVLGLFGSFVASMRYRKYGG
jgi:cell division transport system permease protein